MPACRCTAGTPECLDHPHPARPSFSFVEVLIILAMAGILAAVAIPTFARRPAGPRAQDAAARIGQMWAGAPPPVPAPPRSAH